MRVALVPGVSLRQNEPCLSPRKRRFTLTYCRENDPQYAAQFDTLAAAADAFRHACDSDTANPKTARVYDSHDDRRGKMFATGSVRWNEVAK